MTLRMPAEWTAHERCVMAWPVRSSMWGTQFGCGEGRLRAGRAGDRTHGTRVDGRESG